MLEKTQKNIRQHQEERELEIRKEWIIIIT